MSDAIATKPSLGEPWDVIVIGSGPAAFTAAIYTTRAALSTLILAGEVWGGQLMNTSMVDNFPGFPQGIMGPELMQNIRTQAQRFGAEIIENKVEKVNFKDKIKEVEARGEKYQGKSIIVATGALIKWLNVPGEKELIGRGISTCAPCDAPFFREKKVAVIGGGDTAMEEAHTLTKYASLVTIIHRRDSFKASEAMQKKVMDNPKIKVIWNTEITRVLGDKKLEKLMLKNTQTGQESEFPVDGLFVAIGHKPDSDIFQGLLTADEAGYIKNSYLKYHTSTNIDGVFVAGDVMDRQYKQAITSAGMGCMAGMDAVAFIEENKG
jgi:thioredoxin reductase (NADPH)